MGRPVLIPCGAPAASSACHQHCAPQPTPTPTPTPTTQQQQKQKQKQQHRCSLTQDQGVRACSFPSRALHRSIISLCRCTTSPCTHVLAGPASYNLQQQRTKCPKQTAACCHKTATASGTHLCNVVADVIDHRHVQIIRSAVELLGKGLARQEGHAAAVHPGVVGCTCHGLEVILQDTPKHSTAQHIQSV